jgi:hypothetical protein
MRVWRPLEENWRRLFQFRLRRVGKRDRTDACRLSHAWFMQMSKIAWRTAEPSATFVGLTFSVQEKDGLSRCGAEAA